MERFLGYVLIMAGRRDLYLADDLNGKEKQHAEEVARTAKETDLIFG